MKRGEANHVARQPAVGTTRTDRSGREWTKTRTLTRDEWEGALLDATFDSRFGGVDEKSVEAMGYTRTLT